MILGTNSNTFADQDTMMNVCCKINIMLSPRVYWKYESYYSKVDLQSGTGGFWYWEDV